MATSEHSETLFVALKISVVFGDGKIWERWVGGEKVFVSRFTLRHAQGSALIKKVTSLSPEQGRRAKRAVAW